MPTCLCITIRFLQPIYHGRGDQGEPEWPPTPLRLFQSLVAAAAAFWNERERVEHARAALRWLERQAPPLIVAPLGESSRLKYRLYVPDNVGDKVAASWSRGWDASLAEYRTEKDVRPRSFEEMVKPSITSGPFPDPIPSSRSTRRFSSPPLGASRILAGALIWSSRMHRSFPKPTQQTHW